MFNPKERQKHIRIEHLDIMGPERLPTQILNYKQGRKKISAEKGKNGAEDRNRLIGLTTRRR